MNVKHIAIGCDHAGFPYKDAIIHFLLKENFLVQDFGTHSTDSVDYPDFVHPVCEAVEQSKADIGILLCGSGNGVAITANKHQNIRAALCWMEEIATLARQHNNANVIALPVRFISEAAAIKMVETFIQTAFEGGRHARRVEKISIGC